MPFDDLEIKDENNSFSNKVKINRIWWNKWNLFLISTYEPFYNVLKIENITRLSFMINDLFFFLVLSMNKDLRAMFCGWSFVK